MCKFAGCYISFLMTFSISSMRSLGLLHSTFLLLLFWLYSWGATWCVLNYSLFDIHYSWCSIICSLLYYCFFLFGMLFVSVFRECIVQYIFWSLLWLLLCLDFDNSWYLLYLYFDGFLGLFPLCFDYQHSKNMWFVPSISPHLSHASLIVVLWMSFMFDWLAFLFVKIVLFCISIAKLWLYVEVYALGIFLYPLLYSSFVMIIC